MSTSRKALYVVIAVVLFALAVNTPGIISGLRRKRAVGLLFGKYSIALVACDYPHAYQLCDHAFQRALPFDNFVQQQRDWQASYGKLKQVEVKNIFVHGKGSPMNWTAIIDAHQLYPSSDLHLVCDLRREDREWRIHGCKQVP